MSLHISDYPTRAEVEARLRNMTNEELINYIDSRTYSTVAEKELVKRLLKCIE